MQPILQLFGTLAGVLVVGGTAALGVALTLWGGTNLIRLRHQHA